MPPDASAQATSLLRDVRIVVFDFDGVFTTNQVLLMQDGSEGVLCNRSDGLGIGMLREAGMPILVLSAEENPVVSARCKKLKIECVQSVKDKAPALLAILKERNIDPRHAMYVGNDVNDVPCMKLVGVPVAVADAWPGVSDHCRLTTARPGGYGAVREVCDWLLSTRQTWKSQA
jgi:YrbI family 3-deoxy-D-manno-octulosonate 8-phosphate phosphatase